ncbi:hypothetical protein BIW11_11771, partial [Tropilaelaps mercedesae]
RGSFGLRPFYLDSEGGGPRQRDGMRPEAETHGTEEASQPFQRPNKPFGFVACCPGYLVGRVAVLSAELIIPGLAKQLGLAFPGLAAMDGKSPRKSDKLKLDSTFNSTLNNSLSLIPLSDGNQSPLQLTKDKEYVGNPEKYYSVEDFIDLVKATPYLYDKYHRLYRDSHIKDVRWAEIGTRYGMTGPQMVKKWTHIRDRYKRILNEVMVKQARGEHFQPSWKFFDVLHGMLCKNYSSTNIPVTPSSKNNNPTGSMSPGSASPITTINFANAAQLYSAALQQAAMNQSLNSTQGLEPGSDKDEIIAADFMVTETHFEDEQDHDGDPEKELDGEHDKEIDDAASSSSGNDAQSHHSLTSHKENTLPASSASKRTEAGDLPPPKKRKNSASASEHDSGCETIKEDNKDFIEHFVNYIGGRIRTHDKVQQLYVVNKIHQALFDFEMELVSKRSGATEKEIKELREMQAQAKELKESKPKEPKKADSTEEKDSERDEVRSEKDNEDTEEETE